MRCYIASVRDTNILAVIEIDTSGWCGIISTPPGNTTITGDTPTTETLSISEA